MALRTGTNGSDWFTSRPEFGAPDGFNLIGFIAGDVIAAGDGDDAIQVAGSGMTTYGGGTGYDTIYLNNLNGVDLDVSAGTIMSGGTLIGQLSSDDFETFYGSGSADKIVSGAVTEVDIKGGAGNDILVGSLNGDYLFGDEDNDHLSGLSGDDLLNGGYGNDLLIGGAGADRLIGDFGSDTADYKTSRSAVSVDLSQSDGFGKGGDAEGDTLRSVENVTGSAYADHFFGDEENNIINGGGGSDTMEGGDGDDTFYVNSQSDVVIETVGRGIDKLVSSSDYVLPAGVSLELMRTSSNSGTSGIDLTGNVFSQDISGNAGTNILSDGGAGDHDILRGLGGDDTYRVYNSGDTIVESATQGSADKAIVAVSYILGTGVYIETLQTNSSSGTAKINLTGNALAQTIFGNAGANILSSGGAGAEDILRGLGGNDTYRVYNAGDVIAESASQGTNDRVMSAVDYILTEGAYIERLMTNGTTGTSSIDLSGNTFTQDLIGNAGGNVLDGKGGADTLSGLAGKDTFAFSTALVDGNVDVITDYNVADDTVRLDSAIFDSILKTGNLLSGYFRSNNTGLAQDANDHVIFEKDTGELYYDNDGMGAADGILFAKVTAGLSLTYADFIVI